MIDLVRVGLIELAAGTLLGRAVAADHAMPALVARCGIKSPRRILQAHLDYIIMGIILIAVGLAVPGLPQWARIVLIIGTVVNPALFFPLAFRESAAMSMPYRLISVASFAAMTIGILTAAITY